MLPSSHLKKIDLSKLKDENILSIAIRTELQLNHNRIHLLMDFNNNHDFVKEISEKITYRMQNMKEISNNVILTEEMLQSDE
jgi:PHP family Zn ribbon phosphoesterase